MSAKQVRIAAFDFDGTLTTSDSVVPFVRRLIGARAMLRSARHGPALVSSAARRDRDRVRDVATRVAFSGIPYDRVVAVAQRYGADVLPQRLRAETVATLERERELGARVLIVSASYREYLEPVAALLGVEAVLATELEVIDGVCSGRLAGPNCRGPEKVVRLQRWLDEQGLNRDQSVVSAWGDSRGDREMLAWADHPHWVSAAGSAAR